jgi:hypothetical protein
MKKPKIAITHRSRYSKLKSTKPRKTLSEKLRNIIISFNAFIIAISGLSS